jgi:hypothetical protein
MLVKAGTNVLDSIGRLFRYRSNLKACPCSHLHTYRQTRNPPKIDGISAAKGGPQAAFWLGTEAHLIGGMAK